MTVQTQPQSPTPPQTFGQFLGLLLRGFVKGLPLKLLLAGGMAFLAWIVHTYMLVVSNEGFNPGTTPFLDMVLALRDRITPSVFFWTLLAAMITTMIVRTITWGPAKTARQVAETPGWLWQAGKQSGAMWGPLLLLGGAALALAIGTIIGHRLNNLLLAFLFLGMVIARQSSPVLVGVRLLWSDLRRAFRRPSASPFSLEGAGLFAAGLAIGFFGAAIQFFPPWGGCIGIFLLVAAMVALVAWARFGPNAARVALWFLILGLIALWVAPVFADDGGWQEAGGTLSGWLSSPGAARAVGTGILPSLGVAFGVLLGFFFGGAVTVVSQAGLAAQGAPAGGQAPKGASPPPPQPGQQPKTDVAAIAGQQPKTGAGEAPPLAGRGQAAKQAPAGLEPEPAGQDLPTQMVRPGAGQTPKAPEPAGFDAQPTSAGDPSPAGQDVPAQASRPAEGQVPKGPEAPFDGPQPAGRVDTGPEGSTPAARPTEGQAPKDIDLAGKESAPAGRVDAGPEGSTPTARPREGQMPKDIDLAGKESAPAARVDTGPEGSTPAGRPAEGQIAKEAPDAGRASTPMAKEAGTQPAAGSTPVSREGAEPMASHAQARPEIGVGPENVEPPGVEVADVNAGPDVPSVVPAAAAAAGAMAAGVNTGIPGPDAGWYLEVTQGAQAGQRYPLGETAQLGRSPDADVPLNDGKASRAHARLDRQGDVYRLTDLNSTNGTAVNTYRITRPVFLQDGDTIRIGDTELQIRNE